MTATPAAVATATVGTGTAAGPALGDRLSQAGNDLLAWLQSPFPYAPVPWGAVAGLVLILGARFIVAMIQGAIAGGP